jgi:DNA invertase Pin-like site-specific DNA recombinase
MSKESDDRNELQRRLEQVRRLASLANDHVTRERMDRLVRDLEEQLAKPE